MKLTSVLACCLTIVSVSSLGCEGDPPDPGAVGEALPRQAEGWPAYGGDPGGQRHSTLDQIHPGNVRELRVAWTFHTGDVSDGRGPVPSTTAFENTPILVGDALVICSPFNRVTALDPVSGAVRWRYDPEIDLAGRYANQLICRGVDAWLDPEREAGESCRRRIFMGTNDARLIALDAATGLPCDDFGDGGRVDLGTDAGEQLWKGEYQVTSPPVVSGEVVVVGSAVSDNARTDAPSGVVRGFDVRSGALRWAWDLAPPGFEPAEQEVSAAGYALGTPNVWAPMSVDVERDLVFVPTGNPAPDYFRGEDSQMDHYGSSVVALRGATGEVVWRFQTVHHDLWDFDVPAQPTLTHVVREGREIPAVVQATKMGMLFVLHRETGEPLFPVEERPVPGRPVPGEVLSATQPFPVRPPPLVRHSISPDDAWGVAWFDRRWCRKQIEALRHGPIYTPPSLEGTVVFPGNAGGSNWGGVAVDPERQLLIANVSEIPFLVTLFPGDECEAMRRAHPGEEIAPQRGTPYGLWRRTFLSPLGLPCVKPPWGQLAAVDLSSGEILWQQPLGTVRDLSPIPVPWKLGVPGSGGPLLTRSGLIFIGAAMDDYLRAFDIDSGEELWKVRLPAGGQATPMTYLADGRQYVVIAAGGHALAGTRLGDSVVAFALPE